MLDFMRIFNSILFSKFTLLAFACSGFGLALELHGHGREFANSLILFSLCSVFHVFLPQAGFAMSARIHALGGVFFLTPARSLTFASPASLFLMPFKFIWGAVFLIPSASAPQGLSCAGYLIHALLSFFK